MAATGMVLTITIAREEDAQLLERLCAAGWQILLDNKANGHSPRRVTLLSKATKPARP